MVEWDPAASAVFVGATFVIAVGMVGWIAWLKWRDGQKARSPEDDR